MNLVIDAVGGTIPDEHVSGCAPPAAGWRRSTRPSWYSVEEINYRTHRKILVVDGQHRIHRRCRHRRSVEERPGQGTLARHDGAGRSARCPADGRRVRREFRREPRARSPPSSMTFSTRRTKKARRSSCAVRHRAARTILKRVVRAGPRLGAAVDRDYDAVLRHRRVEPLGLRGCREARRARFACSSRVTSPTRCR